MTSDLHGSKNHSWRATSPTGPIGLQKLCWRGKGITKESTSGARAASLPKCCRESLFLQEETMLSNSVLSRSYLAHQTRIFWLESPHHMSVQMQSRCLLSQRQSMVTVSLTNGWQGNYMTDTGFRPVSPLPRGYRSLSRVPLHRFNKYVFFFFTYTYGPFSDNQQCLTFSKKCWHSTLVAESVPLMLFRLLISPPTMTPQMNP